MTDVYLEKMDSQLGLDDVNLGRIPLYSGPPELSRGQPVAKLRGTQMTPENHEYRDPGPDDLRSPCPFVNAMANHGYIHRDGKQITWWAITKAIVEVYHFSYPLAGLLAASGVWTSLTQAWNPFYFDLEQIRTHKPYLVEHDASLTRANYPGDNWHPDPSIINELIAQASSPEGVSYQDFARHRIAQEAKLSYKLSLPRHILATGEIGLIIPSLGRGDPLPDALHRKISIPWIKSFFHDARLPSDWTRPKDELTLKQVNDIATEVRKQMAQDREAGKDK
ncbi:hypothetical protein BS47DRAFT_1379902 [Hydnum rufescens UP504]|uniref:Heme haloperoxidase family profile domain-containing protein n=1 Tax=Hydnum rufescens UP504 TaxID=1448309 RepID=A0A9P6B8Z4_9AGAM|nr:hypothetical protein BS47DRAFT_1379902 [Hydnum rufescens UP504]